MPTTEYKTRVKSTEVLQTCPGFVSWQLFKYNLCILRNPLDSAGFMLNMEKVFLFKLQ